MSKRLDPTVGIKGAFQRNRKRSLSHLDFLVPDKNAAPSPDLDPPEVELFVGDDDSFYLVDPEPRAQRRLAPALEDVSSESMQPSSPPQVPKPPSRDSVRRELEDSREGPLGAIFAPASSSSLEEAGIPLPPARDVSTPEEAALEAAMSPEVAPEVAPEPKVVESFAAAAPQPAPAPERPKGLWRLFERPFEAFMSRLINGLAVAMSSREIPPPPTR